MIVVLLWISFILISTSINQRITAAQQFREAASLHQPEKQYCVFIGLTLDQITRQMKQWHILPGTFPKVSPEQNIHGLEITTYVSVFILTHLLYRELNSLWLILKKNIDENGT